MHKKSSEVFPPVFLTFVVIAFLCAAQPVCHASAPGDRAAAAKARLEQRRADLRKTVARSPFDRIFAPGLEKHLARAKAARGNQKHAVKASAIPFASSTPNFGGFLSALLTNAELGTACITDPYNCGVGIAISGDFNKDGKRDIATFEYDGTLNILLNDGAGGLQMGPRTRRETMTPPGAIATPSGAR